jgi:hypothetical protein
MHVTQAANFRKTESGTLNYTRAAFSTSTDLTSLKDLEKPERHCQRKRGENPRCHLQPYLIQRPPSYLLHSTVAHNNCLHTSGSLQATRVRASRHSQQTFTGTSYNQTQCNSAATETCHGPSRRRYSSNHNVGAVFQYNNTQTTQSVPSLIRSIVRRLRIIRLVRGTDNAPQVPHTLASLEASNYSQQPPAQAQLKNSSPQLNTQLEFFSTQAFYSSSQLKSTNRVRSSRSRLRLALNLTTWYTTTSQQPKAYNPNAQLKTKLELAVTLTTQTNKTMIGILPTATSASVRSSTGNLANNSLEFGRKKGNERSQQTLLKVSNTTRSVLDSDPQC